MLTRQIPNPWCAISNHQTLHSFRKFAPHRFRPDELSKRRGSSQDRDVTVLDGVRLRPLFLGQWIRFDPLHNVKYRTHFEITPADAAKIDFARVHRHAHWAFVGHLPANHLPALRQADGGGGTGIFSQSNLFAPLLRPSPDTAIGNRKAPNLLQNLFGQIVFDLPIQPDGLLCDGFTPMEVAYAQLFIEGGKDPPYSASSSNNRVSLSLPPCGSPRPWT